MPIAYMMFAAMLIFSDALFLATNCFLGLHVNLNRMVELFNYLCFIYFIYTHILQNLKKNI